MDFRNTNDHSKLMSSSTDDDFGFAYEAFFALRFLLECYPQRRSSPDPPPLTPLAAKGKDFEVIKLTETSGPV